MGYLQTWLLYHNAISSGVEVQDILKHARTSKETTHVVADEVNQLKKQVDAQQQLIRQMMEQQQQQSQSQPRGALNATSTSTSTSASGKKFNFSEKDTELTSLMQRSPEPTFAHGSGASAGMTMQAIPSYGATTTSTSTAQAPPALLSSAGSTKSSTAASPRNAPPAPAPVSVRNTSSATSSVGKAANVNGASNPVMPPRHVSLPCCVSFHYLFHF